jgi:hypothetical protein
LADKLFKVSNGSAWYEKLVRPSNGSGYYDKVVKVCNGSTWYTNYPRQAYYTQTFDCTWTQGYYGNGTALYNGTFWEHDLVVGDVDNFRGLIGFRQSDIQAFINGGTVTKLQLLINLKETSLNGSPDVYFGKYSYTSEPASYTGQGDWGDQTHKQFPNKGVGGYWITLKPTQATLADQTTAIGCICMKGATANVEDMARFNGITTFTSKLQIEVYK